MTLEQPEVVTEGEHAAVNVCVAIVVPSIECPIAFSFELRFSTEDVEAGKLQHLSVVIVYCKVPLSMLVMVCLLLRVSW